MCSRESSLCDFVSVYHHSWHCKREGESAKRYILRSSSYILKMVIVSLHLKRMHVCCIGYKPSQKKKKSQILPPKLVDIPPTIFLCTYVKYVFTNTGSLLQNIVDIFSVTLLPFLWKFVMADGVPLYKYTTVN